MTQAGFELTQGYRAPIEMVIVADKCSTPLVNVVFYLRINISEFTVLSMSNTPFPLLSVTRVYALPSTFTNSVLATVRLVVQAVLTGSYLVYTPVIDDPIGNPTDVCKAVLSVIPQMFSVAGFSRRTALMVIVSD